MQQQSEMQHRGWKCNRRRLVKPADTLVAHLADIGRHVSAGPNICLAASPAAHRRCTGPTPRCCGRQLGKPQPLLRLWPSSRSGSGGRLCHEPLHMALAAQVFCQVALPADSHLTEQAPEGTRHLICQLHIVDQRRSPLLLLLLLQLRLRWSGAHKCLLRLLASRLRQRWRRQRRTSLLSCCAAEPGGDVNRYSSSARCCLAFSACQAACVARLLLSQLLPVLLLAEAARCGG